MKLQKQILYVVDAVGMITEAQAKKFDAVVLTADIADNLGISREFTRNLLSKLVTHGVLVSVRGPSGGYRLAKAPEKIPISMLIEAISPSEVQSLDDNMLSTQSLLGQEICESLQDQTIKLFNHSIAHFVKPTRAGIQNRAPVKGAK